MGLKKERYIYGLVLSSEFHGCKTIRIYLLVDFVIKDVFLLPEFKRYDSYIAVSFIQGYRAVY